ncbi:DNA mismatch repair protein Mlh3 [Nematolebias whitei]|uniref:DNA mismatch repair protein Mlh3 n=1 Tax=Nematolebias whitei TaxID=451745 RepID=UPI001897A73E|nr:DNA mismatch repair protein Mlh3 [Nematolebias whitei]
MIKCLPTEVQEKLRSGVAIPTLQQCVEELVLNSIDAGATCVGVRMDMEAFKVQVIDNGSGLTAEDMAHVGIRYHTSKCSSVEDLNNLKWYGFRGEALASIVSLATLVDISSRTRLSVKTHVKLFKDGKGLDVFEAETVRPSAGTTVIVCNFLHNMPVRRKRLDGVLEGERIRQRMEAVSLMHPSVSFTLKNDCTGAMMVQLAKAKSTYHRFVQIHGLARGEKLGEVHYTHKQFEVTGYLGKEGHYNNSLQYLYVNDRLLLKTRIHKLLNFLLRRLSGSNQKNNSPEVPKSPKYKRNHEQYGVYIINIKCSYSEYDICLEPAKTLIEFKEWDGVLLCVEEAVKAFLRKENLVSLFSQDDLDCISSKVFSTDGTDKEEESDKAGHISVGTSTLDCGVGMKLASEFVHRRRTDDSVCLEDDQTELKQKEVISDEFKNTPQCDIKSVSSTNEEEPTSSEAGENLEILHMPHTTEWRLLTEKDSQLNNISSTTDVNSTHSLCQPDLNRTKESLESAGRREQILVSQQKISLSDPYIHKRLQVQDQLETSKLGFQKQGLAANCEKAFSKRKISLEVGKDGASQKLSVPLKIPKVLVCQKLSTFGEPGSLDKFRRAYVKSFETKLSHAHLQKSAQLSQISSFDENPKHISVCKDNLQLGQVKTGEEEISFQSPQTLSAVNDQNKSKMSLAAKLCHLKQHGTENVEVSQHSSGSLESDNDCLQESNNNQNPQDPAVNVGPVLDCITNPQPHRNEEDLTSNDWLHHYDASVGKMVYVNRMTGLSRYEDPAAEDTHVRCTSDVTNMAVSVISEMGMEYRCYPFQVDLVLPFLPKSRPERVISSAIDCRDDADESSNSLSSLYSKWKNPVFVRPPMVGLNISSGQADGLAVKIHNVLFPYRFSKAMIHSMKVIHQVDKKFLACLINTNDDESAAQSKAEKNLLVLVDQHAAHERVRLESLVADSYEDDPDVLGERRLCSSTILPPLELSITEDELRLLRSCRPHLRSLGLEVAFSQTAAPLVFVGKVPLCFMEKESNELRRGRPSVIKPIVEEYLQEQIELLRTTGRVRGTLPLTVLKVLASLACHGAIKFNDGLSRDECCSLVASLSSCQLPFQCAHGRPSIVPLVDLHHLDNDQKDIQKPNLRKLRRMYKAWDLYGKK